MAVIRTFLALLFLASPAMGQIAASIDGFEKARTGQMVILNSKRSEGDAKRWIVPDLSSLEGQYIIVEESNYLIFQVLAPSKLEFHLVSGACGDSLQMEVASHAVEITGPDLRENKDDPTPKDPPEDNPDDSEPPPTDTELSESSRRRSTSLSDSPTASSLASALNRVAGDSQLESVRDIQIATRLAVEGVLLERKGASRDADWLGVWRKPTNEEIDTSTPASYRRSLRAIAKGLQESAKVARVLAASPMKLIRMETRNDCYVCRQWKMRVQPQLERLGYRVQYEYSTGRVPLFHVTDEKGTRTVESLSVSTL